MTFQVTVPGIPKPQGRPRGRGFNRDGGSIGVQFYDPKTSREWKETVTILVTKAARELKWYPVDGAVSVHLDFDLPRPKSLPKGVLHHVKRPDVDNCAKAVLDAVRGVLYLDDSQIVLLNVTKSYSAEPGVRIGCSTWDPKGGTP